MYLVLPHANNLKGWQVASPLNTPCNSSDVKSHTPKYLSAMDKDPTSWTSPVIQDAFCFSDPTLPFSCYLTRF